MPDRHHPRAYPLSPGGHVDDMGMPDRHDPRTWRLPRRTPLSAPDDSREVVVALPAGFASAIRFGVYVLGGHRAGFGDDDIATEALRRALTRSAP